MSIDIREHGGIFSGSAAPLKYPIRYRKLTGNAKMGDFLSIGTSGDVSPLPSAINISNPIVPTPWDSNIPNYGSATQAGWRILKFNAGYRVLVHNAGSKLVLRFIYMDGNKISSTSAEFVLKTMSINTSDFVALKLSESRIFIMYRNDVSTSSINLYGMIVDISNVANPSIIADTVIANYTASNNVYGFSDMNIYTRSDGSKQLFYLGGRPFGGGQLFYINIPSTLDSIGQVTALGGTVPSNLTNYTRTSKTIVYKEDSTSSYVYIHARGYVNNYTGYIWRLQIDHTANTVTQLYVSGTNYELGIVANSYNIPTGFILSQDQKRMLFFGTYSSSSATNGLQLAELAINADMTVINSFIWHDLGFFCTSSSNANVYDVVFRQLDATHFLVMFSGYDGSTWREYVSVVDISISGYASTIFYMANVYNGSMLCDGGIFQDGNYTSFFELGYLAASGQTNFLYRTIDFDYIPAGAVAKQTGNAGDIIQVYQLTNHS